MPVWNNGEECFQIQPDSHSVRTIGYFCMDTAGGHIIFYSGQVIKNDSQGFYVLQESQKISQVYQ